MRYFVSLTVLMCSLAPAAPFAVLPVGEAEFRMEATGDFQLVQGETVLISAARVTIAAPGWQHSVGLSRLQPAEGYPVRDGDTVTLKGTIPDEKAGVNWAYLQRVTRLPAAVRVEYELTPDRDAGISEAPVFLDLPLATWTGRTIMLLPSALGQFPPQKPAPRHFLSGTARRAVLGAENLPLAIEFADLTLCTVQDVGTEANRFYQLYPRIAPGPLVKAGETKRLAMTFTPNDPTPVVFPTVPLADNRPPALANARLAKAAVPCFEKLEIEADIQGTWQNPFAPEEVALDAHVTPPDGSTLVVPGFFMQDYATVRGNTAELERQGEPRWLVRFAASQPGPHRVQLVLRNAGQKLRSPELAFTALPARDPRGYLRVSRRNPRYLQFDDGTPFFALGENIATTGADLANHITLHEKLAAVGGNFVRWWICWSGINLESAVGMGKDQGLGRIYQPDAWRLDRMIETAERLDIRVMACIETQQNLRRDQTWERFPYNQANGGPAATPADFFTSPEAKRLFQQRLRYLVARWGYSTALFSWQFWNEVSACNQFAVEPVTVWHREMADYLRATDPYRHVIHTNHGNYDGYPEIDGLPGIEVISSNSYCRRDMGYTAWWGAQRLTAQYPKPFLLTEYGVGHYGGWMDEDPTGIIVHNGLWGAVMGGAAGAGLPWGWNNWIDTGDFYHYWQPLSRLLRDVPFCLREWQQVQVTRFVSADGQPAPSLGPVFVEGWPRNYAYTLEPKDPAEVYTITPDGVEPQASLRATLAADQAQTFATDWPQAGVFRVHVPEISSSGAPELEIALGGTVVLAQPLPRPEGSVHWRYWQTWEIPVPAGPHTIRVRNTGTGTIWTAYELTNYRPRTGPDLDVFGLACEDHILLWLRQPEFIWLCQRQGRSLSPQPAGQLSLAGIPSGTWQGEWVDTTTGKTLAPVRATAQGGTIIIPTPALATSAALKLRRME